jgi:sulfur dioxygenase
LIFRQLFDAASSTYTYLLADPVSGEGVLVDPVLENWQRDAALLRELAVRPVATLETHVHADHVTGAWWIKGEFGCATLLGADTGAEGADRLLRHGERISFGDRHLQARATPGHTRGCMSYVVDDGTFVLTGDCLLIRGTGRTDFQQGSAELMFQSIHEQIYSLPAECLIYPGHDYRGLSVSSVAEERRFNPRIGASTGREDFAGYMQNLNLPHPKLLDVAVPANLRCGCPADERSAAPRAGWAPLRFTVAGVWEIEPAAYLQAREPVQVVDVRAADEFTGPLGHIAGAILIPLEQLMTRCGELAKDGPVVAVCRSGARSAQAAVLLQKAGFARVANLAGGMLRWTAQGHPVER